MGVQSGKYRMSPSPGNFDFPPLCTAEDGGWNEKEEKVEVIFGLFEALVVVSNEAKAAFTFFS
jgi:hypothetical protein